MYSSIEMECVDESLMRVTSQYITLHCTIERLTHNLTPSHTHTHTHTHTQVTLPVYLNSTRAELLFTLDFKAEGLNASGDHNYYERGVALLSSPL